MLKNNAIKIITSRTQGHTEKHNEVTMLNAATQYHHNNRWDTMSHGEI